MLRSKSILYILGVLAVILLGVLVDGIYEIRIENQNISQIINQADEADKESTLAGSIRSIKNDYQKQIKEITALLVHSDDIVPLIDSVEKLGKDMGLNTKTSSVVQDKTNAKEIKYPLIVHINIETEGSWAGSMRYLYALENLPANISIDSVDLTLNDSIKNKVWRSNIAFSIYTFK